MNYGGSNDNITTGVTDYVCGTPAVGGVGMTSCCSGRWTLACVQTAAEYANTVLQAGDVCGRFAWAQGPVGHGWSQGPVAFPLQQYYPRDFSLFVLGDAKGLVDVQGPVAAQGNITAENFNLNWRQQEPTALVARGNITLGNITRKTGGTVWGSVLYGGTTFSDTPEVTYVNGTRPTTAYDDAIDFVDASNSLLNMSKQVALYDAIKPASPSNHTIKFTGSDSELNVFSIPSTALSGVTVFQFAVPTGSAVIINVTGGTVAFWNAGATTGTGAPLSTLNLQSVLWNFPDATTLTISSTTIPGSILAPKAAANFSYGNIVGTVVAKSVASSAELEWNPYQVPSSGGCLSFDSSWSCSHDTVLDDTGLHAAAIKAEAGFLDIPRDTYTWNLQQRTSPEHRVWYAFQPAATIPTSKPLVVFFNGGPGSATSSVLFSFNTANWTLDPAAQSNGSLIVPNPNNWTQFANLLYIDAPATGFSYPLAYIDPSTNTLTQDSIGIDPYRDAGIFLQVITRFLVRHPALLSNRVILVPESYGGVRATLMFYYLYHYGDLAPPTIIAAPNAYYDSQVLSDLQEYFPHAFPSSNPTPTEIHRIFGHQIMIEPSVAGDLQQTLERSDFLTQENTLNVCNAAATNEPCCIKSANPGHVCSDNSESTPATCDQYNCDKPWNWAKYQEHTAAVNLNSIGTLTTALGVDPTTIEWMKAESRKYAYGRNGYFVQDGRNNAGEPPCDNGGNRDADAFSTSSMSATNAFGPLQSWDGTDCYFITQNDAVGLGYSRNLEWDFMGAKVPLDFLTNVQNNVATFITVAQLDQAIWSPSIPEALSDYANPANPNADQSIESLVSGALFYGTPAYSNISLPGYMQISYKSPVTTSKVVMPTAYLSGHSVSMRVPAALLQDVMSWYADTYAAN